MKRFLLTICAAFVWCFAVSSQSIRMKIPNITPAAGETILAYQGSNSLTVSSSGQVGQLSFTDVKIKKPAGSSSNELFRRSVLGLTTAEITFEWYDAANTLYYKIVLRDVTTTGYSSLSPECSNCTTLSNEISFLFRKIEMTDAVSGNTIRFDVATKATY